MSRWRRGDLTAVTAILAGTALAVTATPFAGRILRGTEGRAGRPETQQIVVSVPHAVALSPAPPRIGGIAFYASSLGTGLSFEGDYSGRLTWDGSSLTVDLPLAMVREEGVEGAPTHLAGIALALAEDANTPQGWRIVRQGQLHLVTGTTHTGADIWMRGIRLHLNGLTEADLEGRRLVIVQQLDVEDATGSHPAWTYTPADSDLLARLMGGILGGC